MNGLFSGCTRRWAHGMKESMRKDNHHNIGVNLAIPQQLQPCRSMWTAAVVFTA
jgi:hypothetical protein